MNYPYWKQQTAEKPLYPDIIWSKPEQRSMRGRLGIIGGNKLGFLSVAQSYTTAQMTGVGEVRILLPETLKKSLPVSITDAVYGATNPSGGLSSDAINEMRAISEWASGVLLIGDCGRNSETAVLYETFLNKYKGPVTITRDAFDLIRYNANVFLDRPNTHLFLSFAQLQKLFQIVYYPKVLTFSMQLSNLVEILHKFTITYGIVISVFFKETIIIAYDGKVTTTPCEEAMGIWNGRIPTKAATFWLWTPQKPLESITSSLVSF